MKRKVFILILAGLLAVLTAAERGHKVFLYEQSERLG